MSLTDKQEQEVLEDSTKCPKCQATMMRCVPSYDDGGIVEFILCANKECNHAIKLGYTLTHIIDSA